MRRHPTAPRAHALAVPRPAASDWQEWAVAVVAVAALFAALLR
ncbi:hypothetical protein [Anaeromyxobacter sp. Fw109-5]|nr:hypothetical protein [Anaeromyxobacter sp. Fw109-5]